MIYVSRNVLYPSHKNRYNPFCGWVQSMVIRIDRKCFKKFDLTHLSAFGIPPNQRSRPLTFARFISVPENRSGLVAVKRLAACLGSRRRPRIVNPLYLHGPAGTGKTCLVAALIETITRRAPGLVVTAVTAGDLTSVAESGNASGNGPGVWEAARQSDLVVVEDLQFLPAR